MKKTKMPDVGAAGKSYSIRMTPDVQKGAHDECMKATGASGYICPTCRNSEHPTDAKFCIICGRPIQI